MGYGDLWISRRGGSQYWDSSKRRKPRTRDPGVLRMRHGMYRWVLAWPGAEGMPGPTRLFLDLASIRASIRAISPGPSSKQDSMAANRHLLYACFRSYRFLRIDLIVPGDHVPDDLSRLGIELNDRAPRRLVVLLQRIGDNDLHTAKKARSTSSWTGERGTALSACICRLASSRRNFTLVKKLSPAAPFCSSWRRAAIFSRP